MRNISCRKTGSRFRHCEATAEAIYEVLVGLPRPNDKSIICHTGVCLDPSKMGKAPIMKREAVLWATVSSGFILLSVATRLLKAILRWPRRNGYLFFAHPKKRHEKKGCPNSPPYGFPSHRVEIGAAQLALCSALFALKHVLAIIPFRLWCSAEN